MHPRSVTGLLVRVLLLLPMVLGVGAVPAAAQEPAPDAAEAPAPDAGGEPEPAAADEPTATDASENEEARLEILSVDSSGFPLVRAVVSGPGVVGDLDEAFVVVEEGEDRTVDVVRLRSDDLHVVVAVDVSGSMAGEPLQRAKGAISSLLAELPEGVPVAVVAFGQQAVLSHDFTTDRQSIREAVDLLIAAGGTALYDGIDRGLAALSSVPGSGAMVVLADGADSASTTPVEEVLERVRTSGVASTVVALESPDFDAATVQDLADATAGRMVRVEEASGLSDAFTRIAAGLSGLYEVRWQSASDGTTSSVSIGLASDPSMRAERAFEHDSVRRFVPELADDARVVGTPGPLEATWVPYAAAAGISLGSVVVLFMLRGSESAASRRDARRAQQTDFDDRSSTEDKHRALGAVHDRLNDISAHVLEANDRGRSLDDTLDRAGIAMRSNEFVVLVVGLLLVSVPIGIALFGVPHFLLAALVPALFVPLYVKFKISRRRKAFVAQLGDTLQLMAGSLTAGYGLGQTLDSVARETDAPTSEEFQRVVMETRLGRSLEDALDAMSQRIQADDFDWVVDAIKIQASVGGNLSEIIGQVGETIRARVRIRRQIDALTAEGKISGLVLFCLPVGLFGFMWTANPGYVNPMFQSGLGQGMFAGALVLLTLGGLWLKKLINPEF